MRFLDWFPVLSWLHIIWSTCTLGIGLAGGIVVFSSKWVFLNDLVQYGKSQSSERSWFHRSIEVPKRWFTHFYILSTTIISNVFIYVIACYYYKSLPTMQVKQFVRYMAAPNQKANVTEFAVLLTLVCFLAHAIRRLFESLFVSVYSNTKMNIWHYLTGWLHYSFVPLTILAEAPGFIDSSINEINLTDITWVQCIGVVVFLFAMYSQHQCLTILASMRRNYLGNVTNYAHGIPVTGWFDYVSCPHFLFEIIIYFSLWLTLGATHHLWAMVVLFVTVNQILAALITHNWYKEKYKRHYPSSRTALVPKLL